MIGQNDRRNAIVFGGAGFIGTHLLRELARSGLYASLVSYDLKAPQRPVDGVSYVLGDVREPIGGDLVPPGAEVYNLAAVHTTPGHADWEYFWTNVLGATNVCDFARANGSTFVCFTSSISVYGPSEDPLDETSVKRPNSAYGRSKLQAEGIHRTWLADRDDRRLVVVRPAVVFGHGEGGNFTRLARLLRAGRFVYPGRRDTIKSCGPVEELVRAILFARDLGRREFTFNFSLPERATTEAICDAFVDVAGVARPKWTLPLAAMLAAAFGFEILSKLGLRTSINRDRIHKLVRSTNVVPTALGEAGYAFETDLRGALGRWKQASGGTFE